jgi:phage tail sheath protein FI
MAERLHPGVYVEEVSGGVRPIEGVSTSTAAFIGETARGIPAAAQLLTGFGGFERAFGGYQPGDAGLLAAAVDGFFAAGGRRAYVVRVLPSDALKGQSDDVSTRVAVSPPPALKFVARGAGLWANAIRISISESTDFKDEAFRIQVLWTENGSSRVVETFDDLRMDPSHEDYVGERLKTSRYIDVVDRFAEATDASATTLVPAQAPCLTAKALSGSATYRMVEGKQLTVTWWDVARPDVAPSQQSITFTQTLLATVLAPAPTFTNGSVELTPVQLSALLHAVLTDLDVSASANPPKIGVKVGSAPSATITPPSGTTWDLSGGQTLQVAVNGAAAVSVSVPAADVANTTADEIAAALMGSAAGVQATVTAAGNVLVTGKGSETAVPTLVITSTPSAGAIATTTTPGTQGVLPEHYDGLRMTLSEITTSTAPPVLRALGFPGSARGYGADSPANPVVRPAVTGTPLRLVGGSDGSELVTSSDYQGDARERTGLHAFDGVDINLLALPGKNDIAHIAVAAAYCDNRGDCFLILDGPGSGERDFQVKPDDAKQFVESLPARSKNSAMFYPWIQIPDPVGVGRNPTRFVPPSGHVAGIFARTDTSRGVWKAPAGIEASVAEALGVQYHLVDAEQDLLNPVSLNCLRQFPGAGIVSWGTRTLSADPEWRYIPVRRMCLFLKESLRRGLQWAVFEPNAAELWGRIEINIKAFMMTLFRQGAFQGTTPDQAFAVVCDSSTNPQENIDAGIVTAKVAFAPLKPAEFVVIEISQKSLLVS